MSEKAHIRSVGSGVNQRGLRAHNERLILSVLQRNFAMSGREIALKTALSAQTISVILRKLESDNFLCRGKTTKGKVGKPSVPMRLNPDAVFSAGFKVGRRSAELILMDFCGTIRSQMRTEYDYPLPDMIFDFLQNELEALKGAFVARAARPGVRSWHCCAVRGLEMGCGYRGRSRAIFIVERYSVRN